jgi:hypothetical protein
MSKNQLTMQPLSHEDQAALDEHLKQGAKSLFEKL